MKGYRPIGTVLVPLLSFVPGWWQDDIGEPGSSKEQRVERQTRSNNRYWMPYSRYQFDVFDSLVLLRTVVDERGMDHG